MLKKYLSRLSLFSLAFLILALSVFPQTGTPHGVNLTWAAPSPVGGSGTIQGYIPFRCPGSCTASSSGWIALTSGVVTGTTYLDSATGTGAPQPNTTYSYAVLTVDSNGNQSAFSTVALVPIGSFPTNPNPPSGCSGKVQ